MVREVLPSGFLASVLESEGLSLASNSLSQKPEQYASLNARRMLPPSSLVDSRTDSLTQPQSGMTCLPLTAQRGVDGWRSSLPVSPASHGATLASEQAPTTSAGSGRTSRASFVTWDHDTCSWRMSQGSFPAEGWGLSLVIWPYSGSMRNGECFQRPRSAHPTSERESSSWPTPDASDAHSERQSPSQYKRHSPGLRAEAVMWQTPTIADSTGGHLTRGGARSAELLLKGQARQAEALMWQWPTPRACSGKRSSGMNRTEFYRASPPGQMICRDGQTCHRTLNPLFVSWLIGLPPGWTNSMPLETGLFHSWLHTHSAALARLLG